MFLTALLCDVFYVTPGAQGISHRNLQDMGDTVLFTLLPLGQGLISESLSTTVPDNNTRLYLRICAAPSGYATDTQRQFPDKWL